MIATSIAACTSSSVAVQSLQRAVPDFQLSALRYIGCMIVSIIWINIQKPTMHLEKIQYVYVIVMSMAGVFFNVCFFTAVSLLPLTNASALSVCLRMIFLALMTTIRSEITLHKILIISIVGCTAGMVFITQPWSDFMDGFTPGFLLPKTEELTQYNLSIFSNGTISPHVDPISTSDKKVLLHYIILGYVISILAAFVDSIYMVVVSVHLKSVNPGVMCFASACICFPISILVSFYVEQPVKITESQDILLVSIHVIGRGICLITEAAALQLLNPIVVSIIANVDSITYVIPQYTFLGLHGRKNILEVFGCILIAISAGLSSLASCGHYHEDFTQL